MYIPKDEDTLFFFFFFEDTLLHDYSTDSNFNKFNMDTILVCNLPSIFRFCQLMHIFSSSNIG